MNKTKTKRRKIKSIPCRPHRCTAPPEYYKNTLIWERCPAFNVNPRGILIHRVRSGMTYLHHDGSYSHDAVDYWCANSTNGEGVNVTDDPPKDRLLCAHCERIAVDNGELSAEKLAGRHVCIGVLKAFRLCCKQEQN